MPYKHQKKIGLSIFLIIVISIFLGSFNSIIADKLSDALDNRKVEIAGAVYNGIEPEEPSVEELSAEMGSETEIEDADGENSTETTDSIDEIEEN